MAGDLLTDNPRATRSTGSVLNGAIWYFYATGGLTPQAVYADADLNASLGATVTADSGGLFADIYLDRTKKYRGILKMADGTTLKDIDPIGNTLAYDLSRSTGAALIGITGGQTLQNWINGRRTDVREFGVTLDGVTNDYAAWQTAFDSGDPLWMPEGISIIGDGSVSSAFNLLLPANVDLLGAGPEYCRIEKAYFTSTASMIGPTDPATGSDNVRIRGITFGCTANVYTSGATVSGKLISTGLSEGWVVEDCNIDHWNGWGITVGGTGNTVRRIHFTNPNDAVGVDGVHVYYNDDANKPHVIEDITGTTGDDMVGIIPTATGTGALGSILGVNVNRVSGQSLNARLIAVSGGQAAFVGTIANIVARNIHGQGGIYIDNRTPTATSILRDVDIEATVDATGFLYQGRVRGPNAVAPDRCKRIRLKVTSVEGATGPTGAGSMGVELIGHIHKLRLEGDLDCSSAENGIIWTSPQTSEYPRIDVSVKGGTLSVIDFTSSQAIRYGDFKLNITNIPNTGAGPYYGANFGNLQYSTVQFRGFRASGATTANGINEGANCLGNTFENGDFTNLDTPVFLAQLDSTYRNNVGYKTEAQGTGTVANAASTAVITHGLGYTPTLAEITVTFGATVAAGTHFWVDTITSTQFTVNLSAAASAGRAFSWAVRRVRQ